MGVRIPPFMYEYPSGVIAFTALNERKPGTSITIEKSHDFLWTHGVYGSDVAAVVAGTDLTFGGLLVEIKPSGFRLTKDQVPMNHTFGVPGVNRDNAFEVPVPTRFNSGTVIYFDLTNLVNGAHNVRFTLLGVAIPVGESYVWKGVEY